MSGRRHTAKRRSWQRRITLWLLGALALGCRTLPELPAANLAEPGWTLQRGQGLWKPKRSAPEIAGELVVATRPDGRTLLQFIKTPFPLIVAQTTSNVWQLEIPQQNRTYTGRGTPPARTGWLQLACALAGGEMAEPWRFQRSGSDWRLENPRTGEVLSGYLSP